MQNERKFMVYKHTSPDGKIYIGMTSQKTLEGRNGRSRNGFGYARQPIFYEAIQNFGWENFTHEILEENLTETQAREMEREMILFYKSNNPEFGYNDTEGGEKPKHCKPHTEESKQKMRESHTGYVTPDETKEKLRALNVGRVPWSKGKPGTMLGKHHTDETKQQMSISHKGISPWNKGKHLSDEHKQKLSETRKGKQLSDEHKRKISESLKGKQNSNKGKHLSDDHKQKLSESMKGKHHTEEVKRKISISNKGKKFTQEAKQKMGESRKGRHWYTNGIENKFVYECPDGFFPGMIIRK